jgi:hypothetical protein
MLYYKGVFEMKYIAFWEIESENLDHVIATWEKRQHSGGQVKTLFSPHTFAETETGVSGFTIFETEREEDLATYVTEYLLAGARMTIHPIWDSSKGIQIYRQLAKSSVKLAS